jgi:hypothetical protein
LQLVAHTRRRIEKNRKVERDIRGAEKRHVLLNAILEDGEISRGQAEDELLCRIGDDDVEREKGSSGYATLFFRLHSLLDGGRMTRRALLAVGLGVLFGSTQKTWAHHSTAMYDMANPVTVKGTVKRFEWTNPHAFIFLDVKDDKTGSVEWEIELMSLNHLRSYGWVRNTVKVGDVIAATGGAARSGAPSMIAGVVELPDGRKIRS